MNDTAKRYVIDRLMGDERKMDRRDEPDERDYDERDYYDTLDERRGVRGSGRRRGRRDYADDDYGHHRNIRLSKQEMLNWKRNMENTDGTRGEHYKGEQVMQAAEKLGIKFHDFTEKQLCLVTNMMYSDYGQVIKHAMSGEKELLFCVELAVAYLDDPDGKEPDEKLAMHYWCLTNLDE